MKSENHHCNGEDISIRQYLDEKIENLENLETTARLHLERHRERREKERERDKTQFSQEIPLLLAKKHMAMSDSTDSEITFTS